jgi:hypothetical protein
MTDSNSRSTNQSSVGVAPDVRSGPVVLVVEVAAEEVKLVVVNPAGL